MRAVRAVSDRTRRIVGWSLATMSIALVAAVPISMAGDVLS